MFIFLFIFSFLLLSLNLILCKKNLYPYDVPTKNQYVTHSNKLKQSKPGIYNNYNSKKDGLKRNSNYDVVIIRILYN